MVCRLASLFLLFVLAYPNSYLVRSILQHRTIRSLFWWERNPEHTPWTTHVSEKLVRKVRNGLPVTMVNIGGSNSAGGGLDNPNQKYINLVANWWKRTFESKLTPHNIAIGGTASDYYLFCLQNHLSANEEPDIVLLELAVNDFGYKYGYAARPMELLTRRLLSLSSEPLVIYVNFVSEIRSPIDHKPVNTDCLNMQDLGFDELARHYGIPAFSIKDIGCPLTGGKRRLNASNTGIFAADGVHAGVEANSKIALMITGYLNKEFVNPKYEVHDNLENLQQTPFTKLSFMISEYFKKLFTNHNKTSDIRKNQLANLVKPLFSEASITNDQLAHPMCWSVLSHNWKDPNKQTLRADVTKSRGFQYVSLAESKNLSSLWHESHRLDSYPGWRTANKTISVSHVQIQFQIPFNPSNKSHSISLILRLTGGRDIHVNISLDGEIVKQTQLLKNCKQSHQETYIYPVATNVLPGNHTINIMSTLGQITFSGLIVGYPGFHGYTGYRPISMRFVVWSYRKYKEFLCLNYQQQQCKDKHQLKEQPSQQV